MSRTSRSGRSRQLRGHWLDRLPAIDEDVALVAGRLEKAGSGGSSAVVLAAIAEALGRPVRAEIACAHVAPSRFRPGQAIELEIAPAKKVAGVKLFYRHVTQAERFESVAMTAAGSRWRGAIPEAYSAGVYPIEYYFELRESAARAALFPGIWCGAGEYALFCGSVGGVGQNLAALHFLQDCIIRFRGGGVGVVGAPRPVPGVSLRANRRQ